MMKVRVIGAVLILVLAHWASGIAAQTVTPEGNKTCACCQHTSASVTSGGQGHATAACCAKHEKGSADCCTSKDGKMDCCKDGSADCCKSEGGCCSSKDAKVCAAKNGKHCCTGGQCRAKSAAK